MSSLSYNSYRSYSVLNKYQITDRKQLEFVNYITDDINKIIICHGEAGTGKTLVSTQEAIKLLQLKKYNKIVITRPLISVDNEEIGFLPGTSDDKLKPWVLPIIDYFKEYYSINEIKNLFNVNKLEIAPLGFMRGRTFDNTLVIADEMQNSSIIQMKLLLTRIGNNSKIIILGDVKQSDKDNNNGLLDLLDRLDRIGYKNGIVSVKLNTIKRSDIINYILELYE
jgi:phosphate starvation-inducible PhoH-like protein